MYVYVYVLGMGDSKNFMLQHIMRVIIMIIDIITISVLANNCSITSTKIVNIG